MRAILGSIAVLALAGLLSAADETVDFKHLVGKWELADAKQGQSLTLEFAKDMKVTVTVIEPGKETKLDGKYQVMEPNKLTVLLNFMNEEIKETLTVKRLTADDLLTEDSKGKSESLKRKK